MLKIGIFGCGYWGRRHLRVFSELPDSRVVLVCDPDRLRLEEATRSHAPERLTTDPDELMDSDVDAVVIATPPSTHFRLASQALAQGKHVLVEKPLTMAARDAEELIELATRNDRVLMVGHTFLFNSSVRFLKDYLESGELGDLYYMHSARLNFGLLQRDVDVLWDLAPHDLSIILYLLQEEPLSAAARGVAQVNPSLCEVTHADLRFSSGVMAHIYVSWLEPVKVRRLTLIGSRRMIVYDDIAAGEAVRIYEREIRRSGGNGTFSSPDIGYVFGDVTIPHIAEREPLKEEAAHFLECIRTGGRPLTDGQNGLQVVRILEVMQRSLCNGGSLEGVPLAAGEFVPVRG